jgi:predicted phosphodiesterase
MDVGLISDVHANAPALQNVLNEMPAVDLLLHAGDVVRYGPHPNEAIELLEEHDVVAIQGNHDRGVSDDSAFEAFKTRFSPVATESLQWTRNAVTRNSLEYLRSLPSERHCLDSSLHLVHGSPDDPDKYLYPEDYKPDLLADEQALVLGHTHVQAKQSFEQGLIVNPGSVGQPRDGDPHAAYAVLDTDTYSATLHRCEYPISTVQDDILDADGLPDELADRLAGE